MDLPVRKTAELAYLKLTEQEEKEFSDQFDKILHYMDKLQSIPMSDEEAREMGGFHILSAFYKKFGFDYSTKLRFENDGSNDFGKQILNNDQAVANAPATGGMSGEALFEVPTIVKGKS